jgi:uncharacterized integral membrane protein
MTNREPPGASRPPTDPAGDDAHVSTTPDRPAHTEPHDTAWTSPASAPSTAPVVRRTRISGTWVAIVVAAIVLVFLLVFILQNQDNATVSFLGFSGTLPLGVALLFATIAGALLVALVGTARILQLRRRVRRLDH